MAKAFPLRRSPWAAPFLYPLSVRRPAAEVTGETIEVQMGLLGRASVPLAAVARVGSMNWPWWGGVGVRLGRGLVAFVAAPGQAVVLELTEPIAVRAPLRWTTRRVVVAPEDVEGFARAVAEARAALSSA